MATPNSAFSIHLHAIRAVSALAVFDQHVRNFFFLDFCSISHPTALQKVSYYLASRGHAAVIVFFVLSGFLIGNQVLGSFFEKRFSWKQFFLKRTVRLMIVLVPALLLCALWDCWTLQLHGPSMKLIDPVGSNRIGEFLVPSMGVETFFGNLFFLQGIACQPFGTDSALWSLSYEFWYYFCFAGLIAMFLGGTRYSQLLGGATAGLIFCLISRPMQLYFSIWCLGALTSIIVGKLQHKPESSEEQELSTNLGAETSRFGRPLIMVSTITAISLALGFSSADEPFWCDLACAIGTCILILILSFDLRKLRESNMYCKAALLGSKTSFTLYLVHIPILLFLKQLFLPEHRWQPDVENLIFAVPLALGVWLYSLLISKVTEAKTQKLRAFMVDHFAPAPIAEPCDLR